MGLTNRAPLIAAILLLLLPLLYVRSYMVLVVPGREDVDRSKEVYALASYRWGGGGMREFFYPLEQFDRKLRPGAWQPHDSWISERAHLLP